MEHRMRPATMLRIRAALAAAAILFAAAAHAQWTAVAPGIDYQKFALSHPNDAYVARMERSNVNATFDSTLGQGQLAGDTRETVSGMANRYDDTIAYWGEQWGLFRYDVKVAINGDFWDTANGYPQSGHIESGWYAKRFTNFTGGSGLVWTTSRGLFIGGCINHTASKNTIRYPRTGAEQNLSGVNRVRGSNEVLLYTPQWDGNTGTNASGIEVLVEMARPAMVLPKPSHASGTVVEVRDLLGSTPIPFGHLVISATGTAATTVRNNVLVGDEVRISQEITNYASDCSTSQAGDWTKTYSAIGGNFIFLKDSVVDPNSSNAGATIRNPRTALAYNATYLFFIVVDGRRTGSVGMTMQELGDFCKDTLAATHGINLDGGGSSAMWLNGAIVNVPSDGSERPTHNGLVMVSLLPKQQSNTHAPTVVLDTIATTAMRLGPGTHFDPLASLPSGTSVTVLDDPLNGIQAKGANWWRVTTGTQVGWVMESALEAPARAHDGWQMY